jgi:LysR family glycine cleavage system transcriptional activator
MMLPPLNALRAFEAVARLTSVSRAGDELHVTHAAISHQIRHLETWLERRLVQRSGRGISLTPAGLDYYRIVTGALATIATATTNLRRDHDPRAITVGCIPSIAARWLVPSLPEFSMVHPEINVRIVYARAEERFDEENLDVLITLGEDHSAGLNCRLLFSRANKPVTSPHYLAAHSSLLAKEGIARSDLLHDETTEGWSEWFAKAEVAPPSRLRGPVFQDFNMLATALIAGHGVALCPLQVFSHEIQRGDLVVISDIATLEDKGYYIISRTPPRKTVTSFVDWFSALCVSGSMSATTRQKGPRTTTIGTPAQRISRPRKR